MADGERDKQSIGRSRSLAQTKQDANGGYGYSMSFGTQPNSSGWFGPLNPLNPVAPDDVKGRIWDFPSGFNVNNRPRAYEPITFQMLRNFADSCDILRLVIETRKDQMGRLDWNIAPRDYVPRDKQDALLAKAEEIEKFFVRPDKENFWDEWLRMLLEDLFVLDAPAIFRRRTFGGDLYSLQLIDGGTVKRIIDDWGNTPITPDPAYQQILKGMPAVNYTTDELLYRPRNKRTHKVYGFSPVEQIVMTIQIALRRQMWQLQSFTEGNIPEALIGTPMTWTPDQIKKFQDWFDSTLSGNTAERRRARFVPGEVAKSYVATKPEEIFGPGDDWLARIICFCFSISPQPFVKMMNRATAQTAQETAIEEGLAPIQSYIKNIMDTIIIEDFGCEDLEFKWADEEELDPNIRSTIDDRERANGQRTFNEVRIANGEDPIDHPNADRPMFRDQTGAWTVLFLTDEEQAAKDALTAQLTAGAAGGPEDGDSASGDTSPGGDAPPQDGAKGPSAGDSTPKEPKEPAQGNPSNPKAKGGDQPPASKLAEGVAKTTPRPFPSASEQKPADGLGKSDVSTAHGKTYVDPERPAAVKAQKNMRRALSAAFAKTGKDVARQIKQKLKGLGKADNPEIDIDEVLAGLSIDFDADLSGDMDEVYRSAGKVALGQVGVKHVSDLVDQVNERSVDWADGNAADLVTGIAETTRDMLRATITSGLQDNKSSEEIASDIEGAYAFSEERASLIAMTEVATANSYGALDGYQEASNDGIDVKKSWLILDDACDDCQENADEGAIDLDDQFPSGDDAPPAHPNCRCVLVPEVDDGGDMTGDEADAAEADVESSD